MPAEPRRRNNSGGGYPRGTLLRVKPLANGTTEFLIDMGVDKRLRLVVPTVYADRLLLADHAEIVRLLTETVRPPLRRESA